MRNLEFRFLNEQRFFERTIKMKKDYLEPELEVVKFSFADIMADATGSLMDDGDETNGSDGAGEIIDSTGGDDM